MSFYLVSIRITLARLLRDKAFWIVTLLLWILLLGSCLLLRREASIAVVRAGVLYSAGDPLAEQVYEDLPNHPMVEFVPFTPQAQTEMEQMVQTGELECAYILPPDFGTALRSRGLEQAVELVTSPRTMADAILNELVFSAVLQAYSPQITAGMIRQVFPEAGEDEIDDFVAQRYRWYETEGIDQFLQQQAESVGTAGAGMEQRGGPRQRILHGMVALFLLAANLFLLPRFVEEKSPGLWRRLGLRGTVRYYDSLFLGFWTANLLTGVPALLAIQTVFPAALTEIGWEILMLAAYAACLSTVGVLCVVCIKGADLLFSASIFVLLLALLLGGILFDWAEINTTLAKISGWFFTQRYLLGVLQHNLEELLWLTGIGAAAVAGVDLRLYVYAKRGR